MTPSGKGLNDLGKLAGACRRRSVTKTPKCPVEDHLWGGYCESDEQLRQRLLRDLERTP